MECILTVYLSLLAFSFADQIKLKIHPAPDDPESSLIWYNYSTSDIWSQKLDNFLEECPTYNTEESISHFRVGRLFLAPAEEGRNSDLDLIDQYFLRYKNVTPILTEGREEHLISCSYGKYPSSESVCNIRAEDFKPCTASNFFGYKKGAPCVFIELESVLGWKPRYFSSIKSLPKGMPQPLKDQIEDMTANVKMWETIWVSCEGMSPADKEFIGPITILPQPGFPGYFFPYIGQKGYLNPIIAINFKHPRNGIIINIVCKAWGPGIVHDLNKPLGIATFELLND